MQNKQFSFPVKGNFILLRFNFYLIILSEVFHNLWLWESIKAFLKIVDMIRAFFPSNDVAPLFNEEFKLKLVVYILHFILSSP